MVWIAIPVCRSTRCRIFRIAAESSTTKTFDSMRLLTLYSSEPSGLFIRRRMKKYRATSSGRREAKGSGANADKVPGAQSLSRELSQQEIDAVFRNMTDRKRETPAIKFDF